jgi:hypothetical protein
VGKYTSIGARVSVFGDLRKSFMCGIGARASVFGMRRKSFGRRRLPVAPPGSDVQSGFKAC